jgi:hypothetical protein
MLISLRLWAARKGRALPQRAVERELRVLTFLYLVMLALLLAAFALDPGFKLGSAFAGMTLFGAWVRRDLKRVTADRSPPP